MNKEVQMDKTIQVETATPTQKMEKAKTQIQKKKINLTESHSYAWLRNEAKKYSGKVIFIMPNGNEVKIDNE